MTATNPKRSRVLFVAPTMPAESGNGLAMRAGVFLEALASDHAVHLLVVPVVPGAMWASGSSLAERFAARVTCLEPESALDPLFAVLTRIEDPGARSRLLRSYPRPALARFSHPSVVAEAARQHDGIDFTAIHVLRTYLAEFAGPWMQREPASSRPRCFLDADECESQTHRRLAALHTLRGDADKAERALEEAEKFEQMEHRVLPGFDAVFVASRVDARALEERAGEAPVRVVPNAVRLVRTVSRGSDPARTRPAFTFLFVGTLDYLPNEDAALYFCQEVLARVRDRLGTELEVRFSVVGTRPTAAVRSLDGWAGVAVVGDAPNLSEFYRSADVVVVPLRAGGGTRIKILEAFAHRVPVVTTSAGAEGLDIVDGVHALIADDAEAFAEACVRLARNAGLCEALSTQAYDWVRRNHDVQVVRAAVRAVFTGP